MGFAFGCSSNDREAAAQVVLGDPEWYCEKGKDLVNDALDVMVAISELRQEMELSDQEATWPESILSSPETLAACRFPSANFQHAIFLCFEHRQQCPKCRQRYSEDRSMSAVPRSGRKHDWVN